jgi:predicted nuclease of predicted toxin-antitoxin system
MGSATGPAVKNSGGVSGSLKFLVDANLSWRVANLLREFGHEADHVSKFSALKNSDIGMWRFAEKQEVIVLTKDKDFLNFDRKDSAARLLLYRGKNSTRATILAELKVKLPQAIVYLQSGEQTVFID